MASGISTVVLTGNLTRDPEAVSDRLLTFSVAVNRREKDGDNWVDAAHFFDVKVLGNRAAPLAGILSKGQGVTVQGDLVQERWEKDGQKRSAVRILAREVVLHGGRGKGATTESASSGGDNDEWMKF